MLKGRTALSLAFAVALAAPSYPQDSLSFFHPAAELNKKRLTTVLVSEAALAAGSFVGLNELWYKEFPRSSFHSFNDGNEWLGVDKAGHAVTSYYIGRVGIGLMKWSGVEKKKAALYGGLLGTVYQSTIEVLDGFSEQWGFSYADFGANLAGSVLVTGQELVWGEQRLVLKYSYHNTLYPDYRPGTLGSNLPEKLFKDYNGQTYWLSANISSFLKEESKFPRWLSVAVGYGAEGMTGGAYNPPYFDANGNQVSFTRYREFYLSLDADLSRIRTRSVFLRSFFRTFGFIKIPAPALILNEDGAQFNAFYF